MITRFRETGLLWPTLFTVLGLAILISLGNWQMRRLGWKEALIAKIEARAVAPPVDFTELMRAVPRHSTVDPEGIEFRRVRLSGRFQHDKEFHVWNPGKRGPAWSIVTPLVLSDPLADGRRYPLTSVLIIRGTVLDANKKADSRSAGNPPGEADFVGRVRVGRVGTFSSAQNTTKNEWYEFDIDSMRKAVAAAFVEGSASGMSEEALSIVAPFYVEAETPSGGAEGPQPELDKVNLTNRHLEYALTWYGLAVTLLGVYLAFAWTRLRGRA